MSILRETRSRTPSPESMSLNYFRGRSTIGRTLTDIPLDEIYWISERRWDYNKKLDELLENINTYYFDILGGCFFGVYPNFKFTDSNIIPHFAKGFFTSQKIQVSIEEIAQEIKSCVSPLSSSKVVFIPFAFGSLNSVHDNRIDGHICLMVINKITLTVEIYDPNGYHFIEKMFPECVDSLRILYTEDLNIEELKKYRFASPQESNVAYGFQYHQYRFNEYSKYIKIGLCNAWIFYTAALRIENLNLPLDAFKKKVEKRLKELSRESSKIPPPGTMVTSVGHYMTNYILEFLYNMDKPERLFPSSYARSPSPISRRQGIKRKRIISSSNESSSPIRKISNTKRKSSSTKSPSPIRRKLKSKRKSSMSKTT